MEHHFQYAFKGSCWFMFITCINFFVHSFTLKTYKLLAGTHALFVQNPIVICPMCGKNLMRRYFDSSFNFPKRKLHNMLLWRSKIVRFMFLSKFILVKTGPLYILTCFENQSQVAATPMPQTYQNKMVRSVLIRCQWFVQLGLSTYNTSTIFCYNFLRFGSFATTVGKRPRWISTLWLTSA